MARATKYSTKAYLGSATGSRAATLRRCTRSRTKGELLVGNMLVLAFWAAGTLWMRTWSEQMIILIASRLTTSAFLRMRMAVGYELATCSRLGV